MTIISLKNISKHFILKEERHIPLYRDMLNSILREKEQKIVKALENVTFDIERGEKVGLIGANGSGKTTLLRIISGIYVPTAGKCLIDGIVASFLQSGLGIAPSLSVIDNVTLYGTMIGLSISQIDNSIEKIIAFAELKEFQYAPFQLLSSGMQQRLYFSVLAQTMHYRTANIFIFDESLSFGDESFSTKCQEFLHELKNSSKTIIFSSHSMDQIRTICNRTIYLKQGQVSYFGNTADAIQKYLGK